MNQKIKKYFDTILNLIEKQQKEIVRLQNIKRKDIQDLINNENENIYKNYISKDKIKAKIEEIENEDKKYKNYLKDGRENFTPEYIWARPVLQSLLKKE